MVIFTRYHLTSVTVVEGDLSCRKVPTRFGGNALWTTPMGHATRTLFVIELSKCLSSLCSFIQGLINSDCGYYGRNLLRLFVIILFTVCQTDLVFSCCVFTFNPTIIKQRFHCRNAFSFHGVGSIYELYQPIFSMRCVCKQIRRFLNTNSSL